jgi:hypothetical protein
MPVIDQDLSLAQQVDVLVDAILHHAQGVWGNHLRE